MITALRKSDIADKDGIEAEGDKDAACNVPEGSFMAAKGAELALYKMGGISNDQHGYRKAERIEPEENDAPGHLPACADHGEDRRKERADAGHPDKAERHAEQEPCEPALALYADVR